MEHPGLRFFRIWLIRVILTFALTALTFLVTHWDILWAFTVGYFGESILWYSCLDKHLGFRKRP
jgi:hypothetical protein